MDTTFFLIQNVADGYEKTSTLKNYCLKRSPPCQDK